MKRDRAVGKEECEGVLSLREAIRTIKTAILKSRYMAARQANLEHLKLYFNVGAYVSANSRDGTWNTAAIETISAQLARELPGLRGFSASNIKNMRQFFEEWAVRSNRQLPTGDLANIENAAIPAIRQLPTGELTDADLAAFFSIGFTHHMEILFKCKSVAERWYYIRKCAMCFWPVAELRSHLLAKDYQFNGKVVNNFELTLPNARQVSKAVQSFKSEYLLDFVNIVDSEDDEETLDEPVWMMELVAKIRKFIQALGPEFCFMDVKKRFVVGKDEFFADLVFFHRELKCMVAVELKKGKFKPAYLGQLNFYLACLDKYVKREDENPSIGLLLCHEMERPVVELAIRGYSNPMGAATYRTSKDVPEEYKVLKPLLEGAQELLSEGCNG